MRFNRNLLLVTLLAAVAFIVFATSAAAAQEMTLHSFGEGSDGQGPVAGLFADGFDLVGTTLEGGTQREGTAFGLHQENGVWRETVLFNFGHEHGALPHGGLAGDNGLYGTTSLGGAHGYGTVFELLPDGGGWDEDVLYSFDRINGDGITPIGDLAEDGLGNIYGTTYAGGTVQPVCPDGCGTVFKLTHNGSGWTETILHRFNFRDGARPFAGVILDRAGNLYGTTVQGGNSLGVVFKLAPDGSGGWTETVLHAFDRDDPAGNTPRGGLIIDTMGRLYGTTANGGSGRAGTAFELSSNDSGGWTMKTLHSFGGRDDGWAPNAALALVDGNLYGTTAGGGIGHREGTVFRLSPNGSGGWNYRILHSFTRANGSTPQAPLLVLNGILYGTTTMGGAHNRGVVFELRP